jgi:hypothetical protein
VPSQRHDGMTAIAEETGHFEVVWRPHGAATEAAPARTTILENLLRTLPRSGLGVVALPGFVRYRIGKAHPRRPGHVYLHRLDAGEGA